MRLAGLQVGVVVLFISGVVSGEVYYVSTDGNDSNPGNSIEQPWQTLARIEKQEFQPGDEVRLRRGDLWRESLAVPSDNLTIGPYGDGKMPTISASEQPAVPEPHGANRWKTSFHQNPVQLFLDGTRGERRNTLEELKQDGQWCWDPNSRTIFVRSSAEQPPKLELSLRDVCIDLNGRDGLEIQRVRCEYAGKVGIRADVISGSRIVNCEVDGAYIAGIRASDARERKDLLIRDCLITNCGGVGIGFGGRLDGWHIVSNRILNCGVLTEGVVGFGDGREAAFAWTAGIKIWGWGEPSWVGEYTIEKNVVQGSIPVSWAPDPRPRHGVGIWCDEVLKPTGRPRVEGNVVSGCYSRGIYLEKTDEHDVVGNVVFDCAQVRFSGAIEAQSNRFGYDVNSDQPDDQKPRQVSGNTISHNTTVGGHWSLAVHCSDNNCSISSTQVTDNIAVGVGGSSASLYFQGGGANDGKHGKENRYHDNCFGEEGGPWVWGDQVLRTAGELERVSLGAVSGIVIGRPGFVDAEGDDFRLGQGSRCARVGSDEKPLGALSVFNPARQDVE